MFSPMTSGLLFSATDDLTEEGIPSTHSHKYSLQYCVRIGSDFIRHYWPHESFIPYTEKCSSEISSLYAYQLMNVIISNPS